MILVMVRIRVGVSLQFQFLVVPWSLALVQLPCTIALCSFMELKISKKGSLSLPSVSFLVFLLNSPVPWTWSNYSCDWLSNLVMICNWPASGLKLNGGHNICWHYIFVLLLLVCEIWQEKPARWNWIIS